MPPPPVCLSPPVKSERVLLLGSRGLLGSSLAQTFRNLYSNLRRMDRAELNVANLDQLKSGLQAAGFDILINATGHTAVDDCEIDEHLANLVNGDAPGVMAEIAAAKGARLVHFSTDYVFDGSRERPYKEDDDARPISTYGRSKLAGEGAVIESSGDHLVIRLSWLFGPGRPAFPEWVLRTVLTDAPARIVCDKFASPAYAPDIAEWLGALLDRPAPAGIYHLCNSGVCAWSDYGQCVLDCAHESGLLPEPHSVEPIQLADLTGLTAQRPLYSALDTSKFTEQTGITPRPWREVVRAHVQGIDRTRLTG
jgi:dTDP-4-dehydrorhamnose reductase